MTADTLILIAFIISVYIWQREKSRLSFYNLLFFAVLVLFALWEYLAQNVFHLSGAVAVISNDVSRVFWVLAGVVLIIILVKFFKRK